MFLPACQVYDAGELTWAPAASVLVMPHMLINPQHLHACETGSSHFGVWGVVLAWGRGLPDD